MKRNILIIRLTSFGDITLTTHLPRIIKSKYPDISIDYITSDFFADIVSHNLYLDDILFYDKNNNIILTENGNSIEYGRKKYDYVFDLQKNKYSKKIIKHFKSEVFRLKKENWKKFLLVHFKINLYKSIKHVSQKYLAVFSILNIKDDNQGLEIWLPEEKAKKALSKSINEDVNTIIVAPGAKHFTKCYPPEKYIELIEYLNNTISITKKLKFLLLGSNEEVSVCKDIENAFLEKDINIENLAGTTSILESVKIVDSAKLVICNDSALMHVAVARKTPVIAIFGSTVQEFGFFPISSNAHVIEKTLKCRPCTHIGRSNCPKGHFRCMNDISVEDFKEILNSDLSLELKK
ncbi:MAG: hypothetical protein B7C24_12425 [Bacteroidetes bacterium 4572_77]|nr:MAG: hypothetical protein B7C24_12425 [Bacteroidetes bacterium 4572_77]